MDGVLKKTQIAMKRFRVRLKKTEGEHEGEQSFNKEKKKQLSKFHNVSQQMFEKRIEEIIRNHEFGMEKSKLS